MKIASISEFAHILSSLLNEEPLSEQLVNKTTLILSTVVSATSPATHFVEHISNTQVPVV